MMGLGKSVMDDKVNEVLSYTYMWFLQGSGCGTCGASTCMCLSRGTLQELPYIDFASLGWGLVHL